MARDYVKERRDYYILSSYLYLAHRQTR